ncbi:hypothetical protein [Wenyingzhuangia sp. IMCC45467]
MLNFFRNNVFIKILFGILGVHLLNISIVTPKATPIHHSNELSFNNQENKVVFFLEKILGFENAIEEYEDSTDDCKQKNNLDIELIAAKGSFSKKKPLLLNINKQKFPELIPQIIEGHEQLDTPPPKI